MQVNCLLVTNWVEKEDRLFRGCCTAVAKFREFLFLQLYVSTLLYWCFLVASLPVLQETAVSAWSAEGSLACLLWLFMLVF